MFLLFTPVFPFFVCLVNIRPTILYYAVFDLNVIKRKELVEIIKKCNNT